MKKERFVATLGKAFVPKKFRPDLRSYMVKAGYVDVPFTLFGVLFFLAAIATGIVYFGFNIFGLLSEYNPLIVFVATFAFWIVFASIFCAVIIGGVYFYLNMKIYGRVKELEEALPEFLVLVSTNLKGGLSFEKSLWSSIKPEFGLLSKEMSIVSKKVMTGSELVEALNELAQKYDSPTLNRTFNIIIGQIQSGGEVAKVLDQIIANLRKTRIIKQEMSANTLSFTIFIGAIVVVISPLLFSLAYNLLSILIGVSSQIGSTQLAGGMEGGFSFDEITVNQEDFKIFSMLAIGIIAFFSSMILSIIQKGDIKGGLKYMPFFIVSAVILYYIFLGVFEGFFTFF